MATKLRLCAALCALVTAVIVVWQSAPPTFNRGTTVELRSTGAPLTDVSTTIKSPVIATTNPSPFDPCKQIPLDVVAGLGLAFTPPIPEEGLRCHYDAGNYQVAVEPIIWRTYANSLPADAVETTIDGHRAAQFWVMKPTDWNSRWWFSCMVAFQTSYGLIQQSLFYSPIYSNPDTDCMAENLMRAQQLAPYYIF
jgi:hypothetical protein